MKYCTFTLAGQQIAGIVDGDDYIVPFPTNTTVRGIVAAGSAGHQFATAVLAKGANKVKMSDVTMLPPVTNPDKVLCVGLNYRDHAEASGTTDENLPTEPLIFNKFGSSLIGYQQHIRQVTEGREQCLDWEVEQIVVIGKECDNVAESDVFDHVAGYMTGNDVSERILQLAKNKGPSGSQWQFGKGFDTSGVCGPYMVTSDEISPQKAMNMDIKCWYNGELVQSSNTKMHIFTIPQVVAHVSKYIRLVPGDLIYM